MSVDPSAFPKVLTLYLALSQYPILAPDIRARMRQEIFKRGVISPEAFEAEVQEKAVQSQRLEGLGGPENEEPPDVWRQRTAIVRDNLTDFYFAYNLPYERFEQILKEVLSRRVQPEEILPSIHPELAPWDMLFAHGEAYETLPPAKQKLAEHHLKEIKVVLIKAMISDHLPYLGMAKEWFDIADLKAIRNRRIGRGKIGGKAAGLMLAECILRKSADPDLLSSLRFPQSWFLGADVFYQFAQLNRLLHFANQKYKPEDEIRAEFPAILEDFSRGAFPDEILESLRHLLDRAGDSPLIVRSSSLLEDSYGTSFAGKYDSYFCPNQGSPEQNLTDLAQAIKRIYASVYNPDVILYRRKVGLIDYDERMAILIQDAQGRRVGSYFLPDAAGVAFSHNPFRWSPRIDRQEGFLRMVYGLGTRAVERAGQDYTRLVALSHPSLRPEATASEIRRYSQRLVDLIHLEANTFKTLPASDILGPGTPGLRAIVQRFEQDEVRELVSLPPNLAGENLIITFDGLLRRTSFPQNMRRLLRTLEDAYAGPVDTEFVALLHEEDAGAPQVTIHLLQCRPQSRLHPKLATLPEDIPTERRIFYTRWMVPEGTVSGIRYVIYISPEAYKALDTLSERSQLAQLVGRLNRRLEGQTFILVGPGRWGSRSPEAGMPVGYGDIHNASALIELVDVGEGLAPSHGTHFFQDLVESQIFPLALDLSDPATEFRREFFEKGGNVLADLLPQEAAWASVVRVMDIHAATDGHLMDLVMDGEAGEALAYLTT